MPYAFVLLAVGLLVAPVRAGLHLTAEPLRPLPADWRGFLPDHRSLRQAAEPRRASPLRERYAEAAARFDAPGRPRTADEAAELGGLLVRLGEPLKAVSVLRPAARTHPDHFRLMANLGTAWQLAGDLPESAATLAEAVRLAPAALRPAEALHLRLVRGRLAEGPAAAKAAATPDELFDGKPPADAVALVQRLAVWLPADGRVLWQLGELAHAAGDGRTAANILDGCVSDFGLASPLLRDHRQQLRAAADAADKDGSHSPPPAGIAFRSSRPLARGFDPARMPAVRPGGLHPVPWPALAETEIGKGFKPLYPAYLDRLDGKRVVLAGHILPGGGGWLLTEVPVGCWFCDTPGPTRVVAVEPAAGGPADPPRGAVTVTGTLRLNRADPEGLLYTVDKAIVAAAE